MRTFAVSNRTIPKVPQSLADVYREHADFVWRTLLRLGLSRDDVGDAVQDVFLVVHEQLEHFEERCAMSTWLFTICRSVASRRRQRSRRERENAVDSEIEEVIDLRADVSRSVEHNQNLLLLETILESLEANQRNVFILFELERMTGEDISQALSIPLGTVYSRLQLARSSFRQVLARHQAKARFGALRAGGGS
jgi:RNA polymerase sigma-70 factor, ECF subfamily